MNSTLPTSLTDYRDALEDAVRRDLGRSRSRRRRALVFRSALAAGAVAAVALGALSLVSRHNGSASVVDRAAAAVAPSPDTILHVDMLGSQTNPDGSTVTWRDQSWQQESPPYASRQIETSPDGSIAESASTDTGDELYDPASNTIYVSARAASAKPYAMDSYKIDPGPRPGTAVLRLAGFVTAAKHGNVVGRIVITREQARALRKGTDQLAWGLERRNGVKTITVTVIPASKVPKSPPDNPSADPTSAGFRGQILALLRSGGARVLGHRTVDGQDTIEIGSADGHTTYYVDPGSYKPVELDTRGTDGGTALRFRAYETLEPDGSLLSLAAQHPGARVDRDPADFHAAEARLYPKG